MKLRNKKTGEIVNVESLGHADSLKEKYGYQVTLSWKTEYDNLSQCKDYNSLAELNADWEDVKEPLIKDEKIRKAVRAWAEANEIKRVAFEYYDDENIYFIDKDYEPQIWFPKKSILGSPLDDCQIYSITELCGEEEE